MVFCHCYYYVDTMSIVECNESFVLHSHDIMDHEYESSDRASQPLSVQGRLRSHSDFGLQELELSSFVKEVITHAGLSYPLYPFAGSCPGTTTRSALEHKEFVGKAIQELVLLSN